MATTTTLRTDFADHKDTYEAALLSFFSGKAEDTEADLTKICTPSFTLRDDEGTRDFPAFVAHIRWLREILPAHAVSLTVTQFLRDGHQRAERHTSQMDTGEGDVRRAETFMFVELAADGRFEKIVETVRQF
ncbi:hypothetical protein SPI_05096 [Niveomyces insectorum RCEF 264]|uniref:SnoaL-like domain-containing protein n=1 Tax=Niveomyces insectorum RCEF 264 TaxID=1081102 RepID=A0A167TY99_9HYPO|nr:hypothetical protein SPI_05096 [Niveomyces insectorum RCEF 264]